LIEVGPARRDQLDAHWKDRDRLVAEAIGGLDDAGLDDAGLDDAGLGEAARLIDAIAERMLASLADAASSDDAGDVESAPLGSVEHGRLRFASGVTRIALRGARIKDLYRATFHGKPQIAVEPDGQVTL